MSGSQHLDLDQYDLFQLSLACVSGVERQLMVPTEHLRNALRTTGTITFSPGHIPQKSLLFDSTSSVGVAKIDTTSFRPLPWLSTKERKVGGATCELIDHSNRVLSPRTAAIKQVRRLKEEFGLTMKSAHEAEFMIFEEDEVTPFNNLGFIPFARYDILDGREDATLEVCHSLEEAGLPVESFMSEFSTSQYEITFRPEEGVASADTMMIMKEGVRAVLKKHGLTPTFMACPTAHGHANGLHFNHSLWTVDGENAFRDSDEPTCVSSLAYHWLAGILHHIHGLTALLCPTINCMARLYDDFSPTYANWGEEDRLTCLRLKTGENIYVECRLPSSACNPYLALAGVVAAGMDGLARKLECPPPKDPKASQIPNTIEETTSSLEQDDVLTQALGGDLTNAFLEMAKKCISARAEDGLDDIDHERKMYFHSI